MNFDPGPYAEGIRRANEEEASAINERAARAEIEARRLAAAISEGDREVRAVYLFGSLAVGGPKRLGFDIDLAIEGGDLYRALDAVDGSSFKVDLVDLRLLPESFAERIRESGLRLS